MRRWQALATLHSVLAIGGCGSQVLDAGSNSTDAGPPVGHHRDFPPPSNSFGCTPGHENTDCYGTPCTGDVPPELAGPWIGQLSDVVFPSGSSSMRIEVNGTQGFPSLDPGICGAVVFGMAPAPPVAADPKAWPPGTSVPLSTGPLERPIEGFRYEFWNNTPTTTILEASGALPVQIGLFSRQIYKSWCELQDSYTQPVPSASQYRWACLPPPPLNFRGTGCYLSLPPGPPTDAGWALEADPRCAQPDLCLSMHVCDCWDEGCSIDNLVTSAHSDIPFDIRIVPATNSGSGTITWDGMSHPVTLTRAP